MIITRHRNKPHENGKLFSWFYIDVIIYNIQYLLGLLNHVWKHRHDQPCSLDTVKSRTVNNKTEIGKRNWMKMIKIEQFLCLLWNSKIIITIRQRLKKSMVYMIAVRGSKWSCNEKNTVNLFNWLVSSTLILPAL